jgi:hypothetical protein
MNRLLKFVEGTGLSLLSLILMLVIAFAVLAWLANKNIPGVSTGAQWLEAKAQPQG